jgi:hypothetical protein
MNLFSDNRRIIKNNFLNIIFPTTVVVPLPLPLPLQESLELKLELYDLYEPEYQALIEESNPMTMKIQK